jgi:thiamine kinase-like enzyme
MNSTSNHFKTRFYNDVQLIDGNILKQSSVQRINTEFEWFKKASSILPGSTPEVKNVSYKDNVGILEMEFIDGRNLYQAMKNTTSIPEISNLLNKLSELVDGLHRETSSRASNADTTYMYLTKPLEGLKFFYKTNPDFQKMSQLQINGLVCVRPEVILKSIYKTWRRQIEDFKAVFIHGDITLSNVLQDKHGKLYLIDPRGKFGKTLFYGDPRYDIAKLYYSMVSNFDSLNFQKFKINSCKGKFTYHIDAIIPVVAKERLFWKFFDEEPRMIRLIDSTIWLSLPPHLNESREQTMTSYLHGTYLLNKLYKDFFAGSKKGQEKF